MEGERNGERGVTEQAMERGYGREGIEGEQKMNERVAEPFIRHKST